MNPQANETHKQRIHAIASVTQGAPSNEKGAGARRAFPTLLLAAFFAALLMALISGVTVYKAVSADQQASSAQREGAGLICNVVRANDSKGAIAQGQGPEGKSLVVVEPLDSGTYETRFYLYEGKVVQEYSLAGSGYTPEKATEVTASDTFDFSYSDGLLAVTTDQGTAEVPRMTKNEQIEDASKTKVNTAFLIEALVLMAVLIASMAVFTQLFTHSAVAAHQAEDLTRATLLAQNAAEEFSSDPAAVAAGKTVGQGVAAGNVSAVDGSDGLTVSCDVDSDAQGRGTLYTAYITVSDDSGEVYALDASRYESGVR